MAAFAAAALVLGCSATVLAADGDAPDAKSVAKARDAFDEGSRAYRGERFELAASQFEAADAAVPSARALRMAIRARAKAGQMARASTLAEQALERYPDDLETVKLAKKTVAGAKRQYHRVLVRCMSPCLLAVGTRAVPGKAKEQWVVYLTPGPQTISASFDDGGADQLEVQAVEGGSHDVELASQPKPEPSKPKPKPKPAAPKPIEQPGDPVDVDGPTWIESPWVFGFFALATAGAGGVTVWSGLDTVNNPGTDVVEQECAGQGTECPEYQQGLNSQNRTNILIGATAGTAAVAIIFAAFITDWGGGDDEGSSAFVAPIIGPDGASLGLGGTF